MKSYTIHLIRHGTTKANEDGIYAGITDYSLSKSGVDSIHKLMENYEYPKTNILYTSPLKRCIQTCEIIYPDLKPIVIQDFIECNFGKWEGKTAEDLKNDNMFEDWLNSDKRITPPGGESSQDFTVRVCTAFDKIVGGMMKAGITNSAVVTHGGIITILLTVFGIPRANFNDWVVESGCGYSVRIIPTLWMRDKVMEVYNTIPYIFKYNDVKIDGR